MIEKININLLKNFIKMRAINCKLNNGIILDLNGEILVNVRNKIAHPEAYILHEYRCYKFMYQINGEWNYSFCANSKIEMYAYLVGLLNF